ncbi:sugar-transfer associated ATP-grasp domain-containing protein [Helcococcus bovis]|uniref:sugar-transfer associated ATP-grasp domain-containing protein n=1 Tax=Helcococcus bovis TaxID=3153252 RepID=UPI0038BC178E
MKKNTLGSKIARIQEKLRIKKLKASERKWLDHKMETNGYYEGSEEEYNKVVAPFWAKYGMKPDKKWFQYTGYKEQKFDPYMIPDDFYYAELNRYLNDSRYDEFLYNKIYFEYFLPEAKKANTIIKYAHGFYRTNNDELVTKDGAINLLRSFGKVIIKPSDNMKGRGVEVIDFNTDEREALRKIEIKIKSGDFVAQELIKQSEQMNKFNDSSVNTIRPISLIINNEVVILSKILRIGAKGAVVDNYSNGGKSRLIDDEGYLVDYEFVSDKMVNFDDNGNKIQREKLIGYDKVETLVKQYHKKFPHLRIIGWDFAIDENYEPVLIELNGYVGDNQREDGRGTFGKYTEQVLDEFYANKNK